MRRRLLASPSRFRFSSTARRRILSTRSAADGSGKFQVDEMSLARASAVRCPDAIMGNETRAETFRFGRANSSLISAFVCNARSDPCVKWFWRLHFRRPTCIVEAPVSEVTCGNRRQLHYHGTSYIGGNCIWPRFDPNRPSIPIEIGHPRLRRDLW